MDYDEHSSPLFKLLNIVKLCDLVSFHALSIYLSNFTMVYFPLPLITFSLRSTKAFTLN